VTLLQAVFSTLEEFAAGKQANGGCDQSRNFAQFCAEMHVLIAALVMQHTSGIILPISKLLQKKELDVVTVIELIDSVLDIFRQNRSNCENVLHKIFD